MNSQPNALMLSRAMIRGLIVLNALYAFCIGTLLLATLVFPKFLFKALVGLDDGNTWQVHLGLRAVVVLGLVGAFVVHRVLRELLAIVDTVRNGDPFVANNARRLQAIAWWVLAGEGLRLAVGATVWSVGRAVPSLHMDIPNGLSFAPWLAVLLLFVLARVFDQGARMRADLEGTV